MPERHGDWMTTASGRRFWPLDPRPEDVDLGDITHALARICRFGGHVRGAPYSVAQHSVLVQRVVAEDGGTEEDQLHALLHDAHEAYLGDVVQPLGRGLEVFVGCGHRTWGRVKDDAQRAIDVHVFGAPGTPPSARAMIAHADRVALATERRDLLLDQATPWPVLEGVSPHPEEIRALPAVVAESVFRTKLAQLLDATGRREVRQ